MAITVSQGDDREFEKCPPGTHLAICTGIFDVGVQAEQYKGKARKVRKIVLQFTMADELTTEGEHHFLHQTFTASLHRQSKLLPVLTAWRGKAFTDEELKS